MEKKGKNDDANDSSLLLQMPKSLYSFSNVSGSSILMPVAASEGCLNYTEISAGSKANHSKIDTLPVQPLCQLEQPLMPKSLPALQPEQPKCETYNFQERDLSSNYLVTEPQHSLSTVPNVESFVSSPSCPSTFHGEPQSSTYFSQSSAATITDFPSQTSLPFAENEKQIDTFYEPLESYWLFQDIVESKEIWYGFCKSDSDRLEEAYHQGHYGAVATNGGRYDVDISKRIKMSVYFEAKDLKVRRCSWFYRTEGKQHFIPYEEDVAQMIEQHYYNCSVSGQWNKTLSLPGSGIVMMESPQVVLHYSKGIDIWPAVPDSKVSAKVARRGLPEEIEILPEESHKLDHLVFIVQGIGTFCDLRFRTVSQCVDGFRDIANRLITSHFTHELESGRMGRIEFLPLAWHAQLHTSDVGFDRRMQSLTLSSIPKLRHFTNDTLLDILLYSSPSYCQSILDTVASELNRLSSIFIARNPDFSGKISVAGHSLGSLILFDLLAHQPSAEIPMKTSAESLSVNKIMSNSNVENVIDVESKKHSRMQTGSNFDNVESLLEHLNLQEYSEKFLEEEVDLTTLLSLTENDLKELGLPKGPCKKLLDFLHSNNEVLSTMCLQGDHVPINAKESIDTLESCEMKTNNEVIRNIPKTLPCASVFPAGAPHCSMSTITYPRLMFEPACFFALGSPIAMFLAVRGYESISEEFRFPTCPAFFHIFHPYDPVAYRIEPLIDSTFTSKPVLIPHHKGRKRMHLEIRENFTKVGSEIKQKVIETLRYTWNSLSGLAKSSSFPYAAMQAEVEKIVGEQMAHADDETNCSTVSETSIEDIQIGNLNGGRRIDYVLQEKPIEALNDYIFALTSHATYWDSEDTALMIVKEIYGIEPLHESRSAPSALPDLDHRSSNFHFQGSVRSQTESFPSASNFFMSSESASQNIAPPPLSGFVKKSPFSK